MKKTSRKTRYRLRTLEFYAEPYRDIYVRLSANTTKRLRYIVKCCGEPRETNCGWHIYRASPIIKEMAERILSSRGKRP